MEDMNINDLPKYNVWPGRILGVEPFSKPTRNMAKIESEWEKDKYAKLLDYYRHHPSVTFSELQDYIFHQMSVPPKVADGKMCISKAGKLFLVPADQWRPLIYEEMVFTLASSIGNARTIIELGCGYGYNFSVFRELLPGVFKSKEWIGGEYSQNAVKLARMLFRGVDNVTIVPFNYYDKTWGIFENFEGQAIVFTRFSIEQLPKAREAIATLCKYKEKIKKVIHHEPIVELTDDGTLLGMMRRAYTKINDYNTDLLSAIRNAGGKIIRTEVDIIGANPLNPTSVIEWEF